MATIPFNIASQLDPFLSFKYTNGLIDNNKNCGISVLSCNPVQPAVVVCGSSDGDICLVDSNKLLVTQQCLGHDKAITDISFLNLDPQLIIASSRDGTASVFDSRLPPDACQISKIRLTLESDEADVWSVDAGGTSERLLACSNADQILMYDLRVLADLKHNREPKRRRKRSDGLVWTFKDFHTNLINCVRFHPVRRSLLISGGDDDLICIYDTDRCQIKSDDDAQQSNSTDSSRNDDHTSDTDSDDDPTFIGALNAESPPRLIRFVGPQKSVLCAISTVETFQAWNCPELQPSSHSFHHIESPCSSRSASESPSSSDDGFPYHRLIPPSSAVRSAPQLMEDGSSGYIVNVIYDEATERLFTLGGSSSGRLCLFHINASNCDPVSQFLPSRQSRGHSSIVRCSDVISNTAAVGPVILTGSEDGSLCFWTQ